MTFGSYKYILYIGLISIIVLVLHILYYFWRRSTVSRLFKSYGVRESILLRKGKILGVKEILISISIILCSVCLMLPQWGEIAREVKNEGSDVLIALDVSNSMLARDIKPSRLQRAKDAIKWIVSSLKGDRVGLILFAGDAFLQCPLTNDLGAFMLFLESAEPGSISKQGTDIGKVLQEGYRVFKEKRLTSRIFVLISDGEDHQGWAGQAIEAFRELEVSVYTIGVGKEGGDFIPTDGDESTEDNYYRDKDGKLIRTKINPGLLKSLAGKTMGSYININDNFSGLKFILEIISDQQKNLYGTRIIKQKKEQYQVFVAILIILLSIELILPERKL